MTLLYSPNKKRRVDFHEDHVEKLEKLGWTKTLPVNKKTVKKKK